MSARLVILPSLNGPQPQIWYGPPFVGCAEQKPIEQHDLPLMSIFHRWGIDEAIQYVCKRSAA